MESNKRTCTCLFSWDSLDIQISKSFLSPAMESQVAIGSCLRVLVLLPCGGTLAAGDSPWLRRDL